MATSPGGCRQTLIPRRTGALASVPSPVSARTPVAARLDVDARQLRTTVRFLSLPLASAAQAFYGCEGWKEFGYARLSDHARERFGRSARWVRDLAALSEAAQRLPGLASALTGDDGGRPIGMVAAGHIGKVASPESLAVWLSIARTHSVRELKALTRNAVAAGSPWPVAQNEPSIQNLPPEDGSRQSVCLRVPAAVLEAFSETLDLYRAVEGHTASRNEFIDSLIAETSSGTLAGKVDLEAPDGVTGMARRDENASDATTTTECRWAGERVDRAGGTDIGPSSSTRRHSHAMPTPATSAEKDAGLRINARRWLHEILGDRDKDDAEARIRKLISLHDEIERRLAEVVTELADTTAWRELGYSGLDDYARRGLGWSHSTLYSRVQLVRRLRRLPVVAKAFSQGDIGRVAAKTIASLLTRESPAGVIPLKIPAAIQQAWVERAAAATIKRLHDETRAVTRLMVMGTATGTSMSEREPIDDRDWHASLYRQAGTTHQRIQILTRMAMTSSGPLLPLRLNLESRTASDLSRVLAAASADASLIKTFSKAKPTRAGVPGSEEDVVPTWVALLALLAEFTETWDIDVSGRRRSAQVIYNRDGWRCMAPGCTSRRNLEVHHVVYRSQGGHDRAENRVCLCRFHHQMGEHGLLARVSGEAPLGLTWHLGRNGKGGRFRNELKCSLEA